MKNRISLSVALLALLMPFFNAFALQTDITNLNILAIRVEFQEDDNATTTGNGKFDLSGPVQLDKIDPAPHNRSYFQDQLLFAGNYFKRASAGKLNITSSVYPLAQNQAYQLPAKMTDYNPNTSPQDINNGLARLLRDALQAADNDPAIDFSQYNCFIVFHAGVGKDIELGFDETPQDIPSLFITTRFLQENLGTSAIAVDNGAVQIHNGIILPETEAQEGLELALNGILTANIGSQLGWLDLFSPDTRASGIGSFGLMDAGLFNADGLLPALPCAWTRIDAGWATPETIQYSSGDEWAIRSTLSPLPTRVYKVPINEKEYFLVENRYAGPVSLDSLRYEMSLNMDTYPTAKQVLVAYFQDQATFSDSTGVLVDVTNPDIGLPGSGCLIWHIDEKVIDANRAENRINADPQHRGVDLLEADGSQDIGQQFDFLSAGSGSELGTQLDFWYDGNNAPLFKNDLSANTIPNSRSYYNRANSHIKIYDFSGIDSVMTFRVKLDFFQQNYPQNFQPSAEGTVTSLKSIDLKNDNKDILIMTTSQGNILAYDAQGKMDLAINGNALQIDNLLPPPALFDTQTGTGTPAKGMIALSANGTAYGFLISSAGTVDSLFSPYQCADSITTFPVGTYLDDGTVTVSWGCADGSVYTATIAGGNAAIRAVSKLNQPIRFLHLNSRKEIITVARDGAVYRDGEAIGSTQLPEFSPSGKNAVAFLPRGGFSSLETGNSSEAENSLFAFDSPGLALSFTDQQAERAVYVVSGNNRLLAYNDNFTLLDNFPARLYDPDRDIALPYSPLTGKFFNGNNTAVTGIVVTDPSGVIDGFDLSGNRLTDFPVAAGGTISSAPVLLDMDGDGDTELAAVTDNGTVYVWDFASEYDPQAWNQVYYNELNQNFQSSGSTLPPLPGMAAANGSLLPENKVYNWPNPNIDDYTIIRYYLTEPAQVSIKIFDLAGDLVQELSAPGTGLTDNEVRWDLKNIQSGVYLARIQASGASKKETRIIKIAVVK